MKAVTVYAPAPVDPNPEALTVREVAGKLRISERSVARHINDGTIKSVKVGARRLIPAAEVARILAAA